MDTIYDVQQLLKRFGTYVYTGDRIGDIELMMFEINELYQSEFIKKDEYIIANLLLKREINKIKKGE